jgi:hypothetical protein
MPTASTPKKDETKENATYWMNDFICDEMYPEFLFDM